MLVLWAVVVLTATAVQALSPWSFLHLKPKDKINDRTQTQESLPDSQVLHEMFTALENMQDAYFQHWVGTWPDGIDWTRAVMSTHIAATLRVLSDELELTLTNDIVNSSSTKQDAISGYFADIIAYYFGEDAFAIRNEAYDDMLWVVLNWLETIQFIDEHSRLLSHVASGGNSLETWYGRRWTPAFAHRARIFWELAARGWDTKLCGGGMLWNPRLMPYKNAITNQLFIAASVGMFLHFPGDSNTSPFATPNSPIDTQTQDQPHPHPQNTTQIPFRLLPHDRTFLTSALTAHAWLASSNMTNADGLYTDGFHISGYPSSRNTACDERDEMLYTYNQGNDGVPMDEVWLRKEDLPAQPPLTEDPGQKPLRVRERAAGGGDPTALEERDRKRRRVGGA
ncbi:hypothetical protein N0V88_006508 [Collariella sp. IMI 366227]|nr:hypothetical protein N0V88_006508 [Collariella sp. IMI 366227]